MGEVVRLPTAKRRPVRNPVMTERPENVELMPVENVRDPWPVERVIQAAREAPDITAIVIVGTNEAGDLFFGASTSTAEAIWLLIKGQQFVMADEE